MVVLILLSLVALISFVLWTNERLQGKSLMTILLREKDLQLSILDEQTKNQLFILQRENEVLRSENLDLLNRVKSADLLTYQHLSKLTSNVPEPYVPRDDENEYSRWVASVAQAGVGEPGTEDIGDSDAYAELVELGVVTEPREADDILGPNAE